MATAPLLDSSFKFFQELQLGCRGFINFSEFAEFTTKKQLSLGLRMDGSPLISMEIIGNLGREVCPWVWTTC